MSNVSHLLSSLHIWSIKQYLQPSVIQHPGIHIYHDKNAGLLELDPYSDFKKKYVEAHRIPWYLSNKRPERLRDTLIEAEELLRTQNVACIEWRSTRSFQVALSTGAVLSFVISIDSPDLEKLAVDKLLVGKMPSPVADGILHEFFQVFTFKEKHKLMLINLAKKVTTVTPADKKETDVKVCVWWSRSLDSGWPWSPIVSDEDRANLAVFSLTGISSVYTIDPLAHLQTDGDPIDLCFSFINPHELLSLEQYQSASSKFVIEDCIYELTGNKIKKVVATPLPISSKINCQSRDFAQKKVAFVVDMTKLMVWDSHQKKSSKANLLFSCEYISWHPSDCVLLVASVNGDLQIFDMALNCIHLMLRSNSRDMSSSCLRLKQFFLKTKIGLDVKKKLSLTLLLLPSRITLLLEALKQKKTSSSERFCKIVSSTPKLKYLSWSRDYGYTSTPDSSCCCDDVLLMLDGGPLGILRMELGVCTQGRLTPVELLCEYIRYEQLKEAVSLLSAMDWNQNGLQCFNYLLILTKHLFKLPLNAAREACLEGALGTFYAPSHPLTEGAIIQFRDDISRIARKFFHHLLRYKRFEKAYLLAVDIGAKDLFMDIHYLAADVQNFDLARAAKQRAMRIHQQQENNGLSEIPSDYMYDDLNDEQLLELNQQLERVVIQKQQGVFEKTPSRKTRTSSNLVQYEFDDSDDEKYADDPVAWALASRTGLAADLERSQEVEQHNPEVLANERVKKKSGNLQLVHFGSV